ncbi:GNAT family N-acetyltransferase [Sphingobium phenoxybenzoativorans]|uniref:GNAT family N-acetyltransferase n=1 Tax=Sphingobium phenoxybenzoativorans TaxID=1592790 RepID=UPI00209AB8D8|nr:GNAT family N-acetyltransferase [Sphingobium phenoxybenzoativorans]
MSDTIIETPRLLLRGWREADVEPWQAMCSDPEVMRHLGPPMTMDEAQAYVARMQAMQADHGHCFWALEHRSTSTFLGFCGVKPGAAGTPIVDRVEIGWRMARPWWGAGYAREAAQASIDWVWANLDAQSIWAITTHDNRRSRGLMTRLGMARREDLDFEHQALAENDPLRPHVTYEIERPA